MAAKISRRWPGQASVQGADERDSRGPQPALAGQAGSRAVTIPPMDVTKANLTRVVAAAVLLAMLGGCHSSIQPLHPSQVGPPWALPDPHQKINSNFDLPLAAATATATKPAASQPSRTAQRSIWLANAKNASVQTVANSRYTIIWLQTLRLIQRLGYRVNWQDRTLGIITTRPRIGPQIVEWWRPDQTSADSAMESTFNTFRRSLRFVITRLKGHQFQISVEVLVERRVNPTESLGPVAFTGISAFGASQFPLEASHLQPGTPQTQYWVMVGHDPALEKKILRKLSKHI